MHDTLTTKQIHRKFIEKNLTLSVAESCTGGAIAYKLISVPGASKFFQLGVVAYSNESKITTLNVDEKLIRVHGAVSREVALQMAKNVALLGRSDCGLSTTGIAGPTGATPDKPVGLVYIGFYFKGNLAAGNPFYNKKLVQKEYFKGTRKDIINGTTKLALKMLLDNFRK